MTPFGLIAIRKRPVLLFVRPDFRVEKGNPVQDGIRAGFIRGGRGNDFADDTVEPQKQEDCQVFLSRIL